MKILVISTLRLGDILMTTPALRALKTKGHQVHLLINKQFENVVPLLVDVDRIHTLDRKAIERALVEPSHSLFEGYDRLQWLISRLAAENFDLVVNLTHTRLAGLLSSIIPTKDIVGLTISPNGTPSFGSPWFRYLNDVGSSGARSGFHFSDIFQFALGESTLRDRYFLKETERGRAEWHNFRRLLGNVILVQPFSSDLKKDWDKKSVLRTILEIEQRMSTHTVVMMGAPFEQDRLVELQQELRTAGGRAQTAILSLEGAFSAVRDAKLFLTVDTATKHLAAATETPVVELALGGSDPHKTGIYRSGRYILKSRTPCAPCSHTGACTQKSHLCGDSIKPDAVADICEAILKKQEHRLTEIAARHQSQWVLFKTQIAASGSWSLEEFGGTKSRFAEQLGRQAWKISLSLKPEEVWEEMGSQVLKFRQVLDDQGIDAIDTETVRDLEVQLNRRLDQVRDLKKDFQRQMRLSSSDQNRKQFVERLKGLLAECDLAEFHKLDGIEERSLTALRRLQMALEDIEQKNHIQLKLVRYIPILREESL